jgi:hypothetical protein
MNSHTEQPPRSVLGFVLGGAMIVLGFLFLVMQVFDLTFSSYLWPLLVIAPGIVLFAMALASSGKEGERLATIGSVITLTGLLLLYQNSMDQWANWAYAWALIVPASVGVGQLIYGIVKHEQELVKQGTQLAAIGFVIFLAGFFFFEVIIGISGFGFPFMGLTRFSWPVLLIGIGAMVLLYNYVVNRGRKPPSEG